MAKKESPKVTGISDITGKIVKVRHATEADGAFVEESVKKHHFDVETLNPEEFVVATENGDLIGLGRLRKTGEYYEIDSVLVVEKMRRGGIGSLIVQHLIGDAPATKIYVLTDLVGFFKRLGFVETQESPPRLSSKLAAACRVKGRRNTVLMVYEKKSSERGS